MCMPRITPLKTEPVCGFAAAELERYLGLACSGPGCGSPSGSSSITLGLVEEFPELAGSLSVEDPPRDDAYIIRVTRAGGLIAGTNPRSILLAVYRFLTELGFRWVRPGSSGEYIPSLALPLRDVILQEAASYRHRGVCIEGAVSRENALEMVEWLPKLGFNAYFIQFREAFNFYQRWYDHSANPTLTPEGFTMERARNLTAELRREISRRGLDLHMVGHGWTCEPFGIPGPGWFQHTDPIPAASIPHLAMVKGKRDLWGGVALNTNLCYGNPETRRIVTAAIVAWAQQNPDVDIIHFWLADGTNNHCECPLCTDTTPADFYVRMLNDVDAKLREKNLPARIVFLIYVDLLWPPVQERLHNPERFILMFAPITRSYSSAFAPPENATPASLPEYHRNHLTFPKDPALNVAFLRAWQEQFSGDSFDFDYHFMWDHHKDPGQYAMAAVLHEDCVRLRDLRLNGLISCQNQRVFLPTGLGMTVMGLTLWNRDLSFEQICSDYFKAAFGDAGSAAKTYLERLSTLFDPVLLRGERDANAAAAAPTRLQQARQLIAEMRPVIRAGCTASSPCHAASWNYLQAHADMADLLAHALEARYNGDSELARERCLDLFHWIRANELQLQPVFDAFEFQVTIGPLFGIPRDGLV